MGFWLLGCKRNMLDGEAVFLHCALWNVDTKAGAPTAIVDSETVC